MAARYRVENFQGLVIEATITRLDTPADATEYAAEVRAMAERLRSSRRPVLCADHRRANVYAPAVADELSVAFRPNNERFERIAILVAPINATLLLQLQRLTRQAGSEHRRVCLEPHDAIEHLRPALDVEELARVRTFLADRPKGATG